MTTEATTTEEKPKVVLKVQKKTAAPISQAEAAVRLYGKKKD